MTAPSICAQCGAPLASGARFCESCGRPARENTPMPQVAAPNRNCPQCGNSNQTFTAEEFCAREFSDADEKAADAADKWGPTYAQLMLEKPEEPQPPNVLPWAIVPLVPAVNFLACWFAPMRREYKFFMLGIVIVFWTCVFVPELKESAAYAFVGCFFILFYYAALLMSRDWKQAEYMTRLLPEYHRTLPRWEHLRYCQHCEVVWLDNQPGTCAGVDKTPDLLKS